MTQAAGVTIFVSTDDDWDIQESTKMIVEACPGVKVKIFENKGHFTFGDMKTKEFPELLKVIQ